MYLPFFKEQGRPKMGLAPLAIEDWIVIDEDYCTQLAERQRLLQHRYDDVFMAQDDTQAAQKESLMILVSHLLQHHPDTYQPIDANNGDDYKGKQEGIRNLKTKQVWRYADFEKSPLDLAGRLVSEDLCLMMPSAAGYCLAAASVCFPQRWVLREKFGKPMSQIHQSVPNYTKRLERPVNSVFSRLKEGFPGLRFNWSLVDSPDLYLAQNRNKTLFDSRITAENAGARLWLRVERQTIRRMPTSGGILFTIRTFVYPLSQVVEVPEAAQQLAEAVQVLQKEMQIYKSILPFRAALLEYLRDVQ